jgi:tRNA(fMet)-specific endonuclease VapC
LKVDEETTIAYGNIKAALRKKGKPIPENDIWIAAIAKRYELVVVTRDKHFKEIESINIKSW